MKKYTRWAGSMALLFALVFGPIPAADASERDFTFSEKDIQKPVFVVTTEEGNMGPQGYHAVYRIFFLPDDTTVNGGTSTKSNGFILKLWDTRKKSPEAG